MFVDGDATEHGFDALVVIEAHLRMDGLFQFLGGVPGSLIVHFGFHTSEETLTARVVGRASLMAHGPGDASRVHCFDPLGCPVVTAPIGMQD